MTNQNYYQCSLIADGMYHIYEPSGVYATLILGEKKALLVDTTFGFADLSQVIRGLTDLPLEVVVTHGHLDHFGGSWAFDEIWFNMADHASYAWYQATQRTLMVEKFERDRAAAGLPDVWPEDFCKADYYAKDAAPMKPLTDGQVFDLGGRKETLYNLPGHTGGSMVVYDDRTQLIVSADSISDSQWMFFQWSAPVSVYEKGLERIKKLKPKGIIPGHRGRILPPGIIDDQLANIRSIDPEKDRLFVHPRTKMEGLMHKFPCSCDPEIRNVYIVYRKDRVQGS